MAILIDEAAMEASRGTGGDFTPEENHIPTGLQMGTLVSFVELGWFQKIFNGKPAVYEQGKKVGQIRPPEFMIALTFEFSGVPFTGDFPLTYSTSKLLENGSFINALGVSEAFMNNNVSLAIANKSQFKKYRDAMNLHNGLNVQCISQAVGNTFAINAVTHGHFTDAAGVKHKLIDSQIPGYNPAEPHKNLEGVKYYTTIKPEYIQGMVMQVPGMPEPIDLSANIQPVIGEYCPVFDFNTPTAEGWALLKPWEQQNIQKGLTFAGSPTEIMLNSNPELQAQLSTTQTAAVDPATQAEVTQASAALPPAMAVPAAALPPAMPAQVQPVPPPVTQPVTPPTAQPVTPPAAQPALPAPMTPPVAATAVELSPAVAQPAAPAAIAAPADGLPV